MPHQRFLGALPGLGLFPFAVLVLLLSRCDGFFSPSSRGVELAEVWRTTAVTNVVHSRGARGGYECTAAWSNNHGTAAATMGEVSQ